MAGPVAVLIVSTAQEGQFASARRVALGGALAEATYAFAAFFGFTSLFAEHPLIVPVSRGISCVVLVAIGARYAFWKTRPAAESSGHAEQAAAKFVLEGFSLSMVNPTLLVSWSAVTAALYSTGWVHVSHWGAIPFALGAGFGNASWNAVLLSLLRHYRDRFRHSLLSGVVRVMGGVLMAAGALSGVKFVAWARSNFDG